VPEEFSEWAAVDALAADYVQAAQIREMIQAVQRPPGLEGHDAELWPQFIEARRDLPILKQAMGQFDSGGAFSCNQAQAERIARQIVGRVQQVQDDLAAEAVEASKAASNEAAIFAAVAEFERLGCGNGRRM
jgi:hypothetical protein